MMVGWDLDGNEYWEMPNPNNPSKVLDFLSRNLSVSFIEVEKLDAGNVGSK